MPCRVHSPDAIIPWLTWIAQLLNCYPACRTEDYGNTSYKVSRAGLFDKGGDTGRVKHSASSPDGASFRPRLVYRVPLPPCQSYYQHRGLYE
ncbi:hypothetical protein M433DRAFT_153808 [Acidomyces richmondensis BFW]|nr:MAG: hypothetical protein FE78DRAFT_89670 [Acidomyces sp. 'richmondensis']KYG46088.1 hypothetical protein M433DRAFT_153808 [Acidomyces richmondensis BFW]